MIIKDTRFRAASGGIEYHNLLTTRVNQNINYIFGILLVRAADQYLNESILRWSKGGGVEELGGVLQNFTGPLSQIINLLLESSAQAQSIGTVVG